jgi:hypothetical protein
MIQSLKPGKPVFTITTQNRRASLFSGDATKQFKFKCLSESDMIEWMASLQQTVQYLELTRTLIPQRPPEPLFKSPQAIEENVQSLINESNSMLITKYPSRKTPIPPAEQGSSETLQDEDVPHRTVSRKRLSKLLGTQSITEDHNLTTKKSILEQLQ